MDPNFGGPKLCKKFLFTALFTVLCTSFSSSTKFHVKFLIFLLNYLSKDISFGIDSFLQYEILYFLESGISNGCISVGNMMCPLFLVLEVWIF